LTAFVVQQAIAPALPQARAKILVDGGSGLAAGAHRQNHRGSALRDKSGRVLSE
jgi:hypothetical protein